jgi:hypothetical protein
VSILPILGQPEAIKLVPSKFASNVHRNRASLSRALCQPFNFHDARGRGQIGGCNKALRELERVEHFILPTSVMPKTINLEKAVVRRLRRFCELGENLPLPAYPASLMKQRLRLDRRHTFWVMHKFLASL